MLFALRRNVTAKKTEKKSLFLALELEKAWLYRNKKDSWHSKRFGQNIFCKIMAFHWQKKKK